jgi:spore maturation protein A
MALSWVFAVATALSVIFSLVCGRTAAVGAAAMAGAEEGVRLTLAIAGAICLWSGVQKLMAALGMMKKLSEILKPALRRLFPEASRDGQALGFLSGNLCANLLGLGNAATPSGVAAVRRMRELSGGAEASDEMCRFVVLNTASVQLLPATVAAVRAGLGAAHPFDILPAVWLTSACSVSCGLLACRLLERTRA